MITSILAHNEHSHAETMTVWETVMHFLSDGVHLTTILLLSACMGVLVWRKMKSKADQ